MKKKLSVIHCQSSKHLLFSIHTNDDDGNHYHHHHQKHDFVRMTIIIIIVDIMVVCVYVCGYDHQQATNQPTSNQFHSIHSYSITTKKKRKDNQIGKKRGRNN